MRWLLFCGYILVSYLTIQYLYSNHQLSDPELIAKQNNDIFKETLELYNEMQAIPKKNTVPKFLDIMFYVTVSFKNLCILYSNSSNNMRINMSECVFTNPCDIWDTLRIVNVTFEASKDQMADLDKIQHAFDSTFSNKSYLDVAQDFSNAIDYNHLSNMPPKRPPLLLTDESTKPHNGTNQDGEEDELESSIKYIVSESMKNAYNISVCIDQAARSNKFDEVLKDVKIPIIDQLREMNRTGEIANFFNGNYDFYLSRETDKANQVYIFDSLRELGGEVLTEEWLETAAQKIRNDEIHESYKKMMTMKAMTRTSILKLIVFLCVNNEWTDFINSEIFFNTCLLVGQFLIWLIFILFPVVPFTIVFSIQMFCFLCIKLVTGCGCKWVNSFSTFQMIETYKREREEENKRRNRRNRRRNRY